MIARRVRRSVLRCCADDVDDGGDVRTSLESARSREVWVARDAVVVVAVVVADDSFHTSLAVAEMFVVGVVVGRLVVVVGVVVLLL